MLKDRTVKINIHCEEKHCGETCFYFEARSYTDFCSLFKDYLEQDKNVEVGFKAKRLRECIQGEN